MDDLFLLLMLASIGALIAALIKPLLFQQIFKNKATRKNLSIYFIGSTIIFFVLFGITADPIKQETRVNELTTIHQKDNQPQVQQEKSVSNTEQKKNEVKPTEELPKTTNSEKPVETTKTPPVKEVTIPSEHKSALNKATTYANTMHMSKQGVYDQLVSEYGEKFSISAAQYAIDNIKADWNINALAKAKTYQDTMNMSPAAIREQLTSKHGEKFTKTEADYAIQHLND